MIITVEKAKELVKFPDTWADEKIKMKLLSVEQTIRAYTNNNFQNRGYRVSAFVLGGVIMSESPIPFSVGDTVQISESRYNNGLYTVTEVSEGRNMTVAEQIRDESGCLITKIVYPADVIDCCINLLEWEINNRGKVGVKSETLSRHSVTYFDVDSNNQVMGYPVSLLGCLRAYKKVRC